MTWFFLIKSEIMPKHDDRVFVVRLPDNIDIDKADFVTSMLAVLSYKIILIAADYCNTGSGGHTSSQ